MPAHCLYVQKPLLCFFFFLVGFFFQSLGRLIRKGEGAGKDFISTTKCLWGRLLVLAASKGLLELRISVARLKQSPWQPVTRLCWSFHRHPPPGRPFCICRCCVCICEPEISALPIQLRTCSDVKAPVKGIPCSLLNGSSGGNGVTFL